MKQFCAVYGIQQWDNHKKKSLSGWISIRKSGHFCTLRILLQICVYDAKPFVTYQLQTGYASLSVDLHEVVDPHIWFA